MPAYQVRIAALALVEQRQRLTASSPEDARDLAKSRVHLHTWVYQELADEPPEVMDVTKIEG